MKTLKDFEKLVKKLQKSPVIGFCSYIPPDTRNPVLEELLKNSPIKGFSIREHVVRECEAWMKCSECQKIWCCSECAIEDNAWDKLRRKKNFLCLKCKGKQ